MKIIVLQLARLGDIVQTLPAIQGLKKANPRAEISLVVRSTFADAARICPHVDKVIEFPTATLLGPGLADPTRKPESLGLLATWIARELLIEPDHEYDLLVNLTFSPASAYLASLIPARERRGLHKTLAGGIDSYVLTDPWSQYFYSHVLANSINILHLNDLFTRIAGVGAGSWPLEIREPGSSVPVQAKSPEKLRIGIQVAASRNDKTPNEEVWAEICNALLARHLDTELVFFGAKPDAPAIDLVLRKMRSISDGLRQGACRVLAGSMPFHENLDWVRSCDWLIGPDSALAHLASVAGTKVIQIPLGSVRPQETGPYGEGHHIVYPLRSTPAELASAVAAIIAGENAGRRVAHAKTRLVACNDGSLRNDLVAANYVPEETAHFFEKAYYLLAEFRCAGRQEDIEVPVLGAPDQPGALDRLVKIYDILCSTRRLAEHGRHYCVEMIKNLEDKTRLGELLGKIAEADSLLITIQNSVSLVKPLIDTWRVAKDVPYAPTKEAFRAATISNGASAEEILAIAEGSYRELAQNIEIVQQLLQTAVEAAQKRQAQKASPIASTEPETKERV